jgi:hypothetical protein
MKNEIARLETPIDVMYLIHEALTVEAASVQKLIENMELGSSLQPFRAAFNFWATALMYHADIEDQNMTGPMTDFQQARDNETEHAQLGGMLEALKGSLESADRRGLNEQVRHAIVALHDEQHTELMERLEDVLACLDDEIGRTRVIARTRRHLYGKIVELKICQDDHLESEEAFVLPEVRERLSVAQQLELARKLLVDEGSDNPEWVYDWVARSIDLDKQSQLSQLRAQYEAVSPGAQRSQYYLDQAADT